MLNVRKYGSCNFHGETMSFFVSFVRFVVQMRFSV